MKKQLSEIQESNNIESISQTNLDNYLYLSQKFRTIQNSFEQFNEEPNVKTLKIDEILRNNFPIIFFGSRGYGKTTLARRIHEQIAKLDHVKQIKPILISAQKESISDFKSILKLNFPQNDYQQIENFEQNIQNDQIRVVIIIDDFDVILQQKQEFLQNIQDSIWKKKCKFIYFLNSSIRKDQTYHNWIQFESMLSQFEIMQFNKVDVKNYFEQYITWDECLSNQIILQQNMNDIIQLVVAKIKNSQNIHNILIKIIKLSSIVDDMEQEAGNAMMLLREMRQIIRNQDFSFIRMKNSSLNFLSFHKCNFEGSEMQNVDISRCWFISCNLNYVQWKNMIKNEVQLDLKNQQNREVESVICCNQNQFFAVRFRNQMIELYHIKSGKRLNVVRNYKKPVNYLDGCPNMTFSSNGILIFSNLCEEEKKIQICQTAKIIRKFNFISDQYSPIALSNDNQLLAFEVEKEGIYILNVVRGIQIQTFEIKGYFSSRQLQFSNDDNLLASCKWNCTIHIWNIKQKQLIFIKKLKRESDINSFSPDLKYLASIEQMQNQIIVSNVITKIEIRKNIYDAEITAILFSPTGKFIACGFKGGAVALFSLIEKKADQPITNSKTQNKSECFDIIRTKDWNYLMSSDCHEENKIISLMFSANESYLISGNSEGTIKFHDFQDHTKLEQSDSQFYCLAFSRSGKILAFGSKENEKIVLWDKDEQNLTELALETRNNQCLSITFSFDEQLLIYSYNYKAMLWNFKRRELISDILHGLSVKEVIFSPTELILAFCCYSDNAIFIQGITIKQQVKKQVEMKKQKQIRTENNINQIVYSLCGSLIAYCGKGNLCIWDIKSEQTSRIFEVNEQISNFVTIAFSPDGKVLASGGPNEITLWNIEQVSKIQSIQEGTNYIKYSPTGQILASAMRDSTIKIWHVSISSVLEDPMLFIGHSQQVQNLDFSQDGTTLATSSYLDGQILIWDIQKENQNSFSITPLYAFTNNFAVNASNSSLKDAQIVSNKGVNLMQLFLQMGGKR